MLELPNMRRPKHYSRIGLVLTAIALLHAGVALAQSGRKSPKVTTTTTPSVSGPKTVEKTTPKTQKLQLLVGIYTVATVAGIPYYISDTVLDTCVRRLGDAAEVLATSGGRDMTRSDAIKAAREGKERYVVWLEVGSDMVDAGQRSPNEPSELYVRYTIFEPVTAKIKRSGRSFHGIYKVGGVGVSGPGSRRNSPLYSEYALRQSAREAAERVLDAFDIKLPDQR